MEGKKNHFITKILCFVSPELKAHVPFNNYFLFDTRLLVYDFFEKKKILEPLSQFKKSYMTEPFLDSLNPLKHQK